MLDFLDQEATKTETEREALRANENVRFVDREEFCRLLTSGNVLSRCDVPVARVRGVVDLNAGNRFLIEEERLFDLDRRA